MDTLKLSYIDILVRTQFATFENNLVEGQVEVTYHNEDDLLFAIRLLSSFWP